MPEAEEPLSTTQSIKFNSWRCLYNWQKGVLLGVGGVGGSVWQGVQRGCVGSVKDLWNSGCEDFPWTEPRVCRDDGTLEWAQQGICLLSLLGVAWRETEKMYIFHIADGECTSETSLMTNDGLTQSGIGRSPPRLPAVAIASTWNTKSLSVR